MEDPGKFLSLYLRFNDLFFPTFSREANRERGTLSYLGVVDRAVGDDGEEGESEGECGGDTCTNGNAGTTLHFFSPFGKCW